MWGDISGEISYRITGIHGIKSTASCKIGILYTSCYIGTGRLLLISTRTRLFSNIRIIDYVDNYKLENYIPLILLHANKTYF